MSTSDRAVASPRSLALGAIADRAIYAHYRDLFAGALARLAANGFAAPPDEGLDLIHGFFAELWNDVAPRHDPSRAKFDTYIYGCFINYARPRIVRFRRTRGLLVEPALIDSVLTRAEAPDEHETEPLDLAAVRDALGRLPALTRLILRDYLDDDAPSERALGAKFGLTRHAIRMQLSDGIGGAMVVLGDLSALSDDDRSIAVSLFRDRRTVAETARYLRREIAAIQDARSRWLGLLVQAVRGRRSMETMHHATAPARESGEATAADLLVAALRSDAAETADAALREHREAIWRFLGGAEAEPLLAPYVDTDPARVARVYALLADEADDADARQGGEYDIALGARETDEAMIGEAFKVLMNGLDGDVARPWKYFAQLPEVDGETFAQLRENRSVQVANGLAIDLARYGMTPVTIAKASLSVSTLALRFCRQHAITVGGRLVLEGRSPPKRTKGHAILRWSDAIDNLARSIDLPRDTLGLMYAWLLDVASFTPLIFEDFEAYGWEGGVTLARTDRSEPELVKRWNATATVASHQYGYV